jgi:hypothetical protein
MNLQQMPFWQRVCAVLSAVWVIVYGSLYLSALGGYFVYNWQHPNWILNWYAWNPIAKFVPLFDNDAYPAIPQFDIFGFLFLLGFGPLVIWAAGFSVMWIQEARSPASKG